MIKRRNCVIILCVLHSLPFQIAQTMQLEPFPMQFAMAVEDLDPSYFPVETDCDAQMLRRDEGIYSFASNGVATFCSLYVVAPVDTNVHFQFLNFNVGCDYGAGVALLDGWEVNTEIFPTSEDQSKPMEERYVDFCGENSPARMYMAQQNAAQVQFYVPTHGEGFSVAIFFKLNRKPCNMLIMDNWVDRITLKNYGLERNCSVLSFHPHLILFHWFDVGRRNKQQYPYNRDSKQNWGLRTACFDARGSDRIEVFKGVGIGPIGRTMLMDFCGKRRIKEPAPIPATCESTTIRMVSSGRYFNSLQVSLTPADGVGKLC